MLTSTARDLFTAIATCAAALTGLLFVAISVAPGRTAMRRPPVVKQVRTAAALLAFSNALVVSLFGLVPGNNIGYPALAVGVIGVFFTAAAVRSLFVLPEARPHRRRQCGLIGLLLFVFGFEVGAGIVLLARPRSADALEWLGNLLVASLVIGVARAWELVGDRDTGILASIAILAGRGTDTPSSREGEPTDLPAAALDQAPAGAAPAGRAGPAVTRPVEPHG